MAGPTWSDVTSAPEWETLQPAQRAVVQQKFFSDVVTPNIPEGIDPKDAWSQFSQHTQPSVAMPVRATGLRAAIANTPFGMAADAMDPNSDSAGGNLVRGFGRGLLRGGRGLLMAGAGANEVLNPNSAADANATLFGMADSLKGYEDRIQQPRSTGGNIAQGAGGFGAGIVTAGAGEAGARGQDLLDSGATLGQAETGAAISGAESVAGIAMGGINKIGSLGGRILGQTAAGGTLYEGGRRLSNAIQPDSLHQNFDPVELGMSAGGAAVAAFSHRGGEQAKPIDKGSDLLNPGQNASIGTEDATTHAAAGVPPEQTFTRGYEILRDSSGKPFGVSPSGGGEVTRLNGRDVNDVIDSMRQPAPYKSPMAAHVGTGDESNVIDSTARDVTQKALSPPSGGPPAPSEQLALPPPSNFDVQPDGQARIHGQEGPAPHGLQDRGVPTPPASSEITGADGQPIHPADTSWVDVDPRKNPTEFGLPPSPGRPQGLLEIIARGGGLNIDAFKSQFSADPAIMRDRKTNQYVPGSPLFRKKGGMTPDKLREMMQQEGYLAPDDPGGPPKVGADDANDLLDSALAGKKIYPSSDKKAEWESTVADIEHQQNLAREHNKMASDLRMSPHSLEHEVDRTRSENMPTDVAHMDPVDAHQAMSLDDMESLAMRNGVKPMDIHRADEAAANHGEFARKLTELTDQARNKNGTDQGTTQRGDAPGDSATPGGDEPVLRGGGADQGNDTGAEGGVRGTGQEPAAPAGADTSAPSGQVDAFAAGSGAERNRAAIAAKDLARNTGTVTDKGDGGLFDGPRPQQDSFASRVDKRAAKGVAVQRARELITQRFGRVADMLFKNGKLHIVADEADLPRGMEHLSSDNGLLQGVHNPDTGESWVVGNSLDEHNVTGVVMHEVGVHAGMAKLLGPDKMSRLAGQLRVIHATGKPAEKTLIGESLRRIDNEKTSSRDEELVAHTIEQVEAARQGESITPRMKVWLADAVSHIKAGLYNMGWLKAKHLSLNDIRHLAEGAMKRVARGTIPDNSTEARNEQLKADKNSSDAASTKPSGKDRAGNNVAPEPGAARPSADDVSRPSAEGIHTNEVDTSDTGASANLKNWFGDGVLKDGNGNPKALYRADDHDLTSWDHNRAGAATGSPGSALGMFLAEHDSATDGYGDKVVSGYARLKNPAHENLAETTSKYTTHEAMVAHRAELEAKGHDGIVFDDADQVAVFDPNRDFKRADNHGSFDENTPHFMFSRVKENENSAHDAEDVHTEAPKAEPTLRVAAAAKLGTLMHDFFMKVAPMADNQSSAQARAVAKDFANTLRMAGHEAVVSDRMARDNFTPDQQKKMWAAANEHSEAVQQGKPTKGIGLDRLEPNERAFVEHEQARSQEALQAAVEAGLFDGSREKIPSYVPRMVIRRLASGIADKFGKNGPGAKDGANVRTSSPGLMARKHLLNEDTESAAQARNADAEVFQNIRTLPIATRRLWEAVAGRKLINQIRDAGTAVGQEFMHSGAKPGEGWFTIDHPAFTEYARRTETDPDTGKLRNALDEFHEPIYDPKQIWIRKDFEGPLKAVMSQHEGELYKFFMEAKTKSMTGIMISPAIHLMTEVGRALPAAPGKFLTGKIFSAGRDALANKPTMREALENGLAPIAGRGGSNDAVELANEVNLKPGRSWTSQVLAYIPGLFDAKAGEAVKATIDKWGDVWHNKLLWDQIAKLQMGLYVHFRDEAIKGGFSRTDAAKMAAHEANRFAGTLPKESMSIAARKIANLAMFSRTFTLGNWGVMKDMIGGLPKDVQAQIMRSSGADGLARAQSYTRRKSAAILALDVGLMYVSNSLLQNAFAVMNGSTVNKEMDGYVRRAQEMMQTVEKSPLEIFHLLGDLSATHDNEPGKRDRILVGHAKDGTAIYMRNPFGKIGEEFTNWASEPIDMLKKKLSPLARGLSETYNNDQGFGQKIYNPQPRTDAESWQNAAKIVTHFLGDQLNTSLIADTKSILAGDKNASMSALKLAGNLTGFTASKGAPGGEAVGLMYDQKNEHSYDLQQQLPAIRKQIEGGDIPGAVKAMAAIGVPPKIMEYYIKTTMNPSSRLSAAQLQKFMQTASPEQSSLMQRYLRKDQ